MSGRLLQSPEPSWIPLKITSRRAFLRACSIAAALFVPLPQVRRSMEPSSSELRQEVLNEA
ncbi:MAG: twin-arginine translocation signal domain-containing protein [Muribaculaceae bacterium]